MVAALKNRVAAPKKGVAGLKKTVAAAGFAVAAFCLASVPGDRAQAAAGGGDNLCRSAVVRAAERLGIPPGLLVGIALTESGRTWRGRWMAWPWSINVDGLSLYFDDAGQAAAAVRRLGRSGASNIDVGCLQVSLRWWSHSFETVEQALDPETNAWVAGRVLIWLHSEHGTWDAAVAAYHAGKPGRPIGRRYLCKVYGQMMREATGRTEPHPRCGDVKR